MARSCAVPVGSTLALERPELPGALVLIGTEADLANLGPRMQASAERIESDGIERWVDEVWSKNPPFAEPSLERYPLLPGVRGDLLAKLGRLEEARAEFARAAALTRNARERELLLERAQAAKPS